MTKDPTPKEKLKKQCDNTNATKTFDCTTTADRLRTIRWVTIATQLVWLNRFTPSRDPSRQYYDKKAVYFVSIMTQTPTLKENTNVY